ncbi:MAG: O-antigen ligase family protein [Ignavibacteria bacterium]|nr:O-antigen ligase family protein [Ignavibacteria bacterium]
MAVFSSQFSIATSSIGIGGLIILTVFKLFISNKNYVLQKNLIYFFGAFIIIQIISSLVCGNPAESFDNIFRRISIYIIFFASILFIKSSADLKKLLILYICFTALISTVEIIRFSLEYIPHPTKPISEYRLEYYGYPATNGEIKMSILLLIIPFFLLKKNYLMNKFLLALCTLPLLITFYLTNARNAVMGLFTGILIYGLIKNRWFLAVVLVLILLFLVAAPLPVKERVLSIADLNHPSNHSRIVMWETGVKIIKDNLLFGVGDVDINKVYRMYKTPEFHGEGSHMHSNIFQILVNFGVIGFIFWLALMIYLFTMQIKTYIKTRKFEFLNILALISITSMAALQVSGLTEWNFGDAEYAAVFWFNLALAFSAYRLSTKGDTLS